MCKSTRAQLLEQFRANRAEIDQYNQIRREGNQRYQEDLISVLGSVEGKVKSQISSAVTSNIRVAVDRDRNNKLCATIYFDGTFSSVATVSYDPETQKFIVDVAFSSMNIQSQKDAEALQKCIEDTKCVFSMPWDEMFAVSLPDSNEYAPNIPKPAQLDLTDAINEATFKEIIGTNLAAKIIPWKSCTVRERAGAWVTINGETDKFYHVSIVPAKSTNFEEDAIDLPARFHGSLCFTTRVRKDSLRLWTADSELIDVSM